MNLSELLAGQPAPVFADRLAVVVAHPDDETIGCGAQLARWEKATVVVVTDGAPRDLADARDLGFESAHAYAQARRRELEHALGIAGVPTSALVGLSVPDQRAAWQLPEISRSLALTFRERRIETVITHSYEGGHPDHDAVAFAVHAAARMLCGKAPTIIEMPLYRRSDRHRVIQSFAPEGGAAPFEVQLCSDQRAMKREMVAAYRTQARVLGDFPIAIEQFRVAPEYDFGLLPNDGLLEYEHHPWGLTGVQWRELAPAALRDLCIGDGSAAC